MNITAVDDVRSKAKELLGPAPDPDWVAAPSGYRIPVRRYGIGGGRRPVVMLHGLESHSGWFVQSARRIAALGLPVHAFDRCGSGVSQADPELGARFDALLAEVDAVAASALAGTGYDSVHLVGHCFGALLAILYAALHRPARLGGVVKAPPPRLVLATPALYTRTDLPPRDKLRVLASLLRRRGPPVRIPLAPEEFSELEPYVELVRGDRLLVRAVPGRLFYEILRARGRLGAAARALRAPLLFAMAADDPICDNPRNQRLYERVTAQKQLREYPGARHILEFSGARAAFLDDLAVWYERWEGH
jgi:acylglycerol lipase